MTQYHYNSKGELTTADRYLGDDPGFPGTPVDPESFLYQFDDIGNRKLAQRAPNQVGGPTSNINYVPTLLNQYDQIDETVPSVTSTQPAYDLDGNLTDDGNYAYTWNAENRLIRMTRLTPVDGDVLLEFTYDYIGRRISKAVFTYEQSSATYVLQETFLLFYDGWNLIEEQSYRPTPGNTYTPANYSNFLANIQTQATEVSPIYSTHFTWGLDMSDSLQGAGGIGGLLAVSKTAGGFTTHAYPTYDGNGNVSQYIDEERL